MDQVWPRHHIEAPRQCLLIDYGGVFAMHFDARTRKLFTGKSHNYSPDAYYHLYLEELRAKWNLTALNEHGRRDNAYRITVELVRFYLRYAPLENATFTRQEWSYMVDARARQDEVEHVRPVGINPSNQTYMQLIWCHRHRQIRDLRTSRLGSKKTDGRVYTEAQKAEFFALLEILERAAEDTKAVNATLCDDILSRAS